MKTCGHVVLEKAEVNGIHMALAVCGDLDYIPLPDEAEPVTGALKGRIAAAFQNDFTGGVSRYGEDYLQAAVLGYSMSPAGETPLFGPGAGFGRGCAGILAAGSNAYVYVTEGSGMCIVRITDVFGKKKAVRCISSEEGGEDILGLEKGAVLIACPECWTFEYLEENKENGKSLEDFVCLFDPDDVERDEALDRRMAELAGEGFDGCAAALIVR